MSRETKKKMADAKKRFEAITGLPTSFGIQNNEGIFFYDEEKGEFVRKNNRWMADNSRQWMADNPSNSLEMERTIISAVSNPYQTGVYSQNFRDNSLINENREIFNNQEEIEGNENNFLSHSQPTERRNSYPFTGNSSSYSQNSSRNNRRSASESRAQEKKRRTERAKDKYFRESQQAEVFTQRQLIFPKKY